MVYFNRAPFCRCRIEATPRRPKVRLLGVRETRLRISTPCEREKELWVRTAQDVPADASTAGTSGDHPYPAGCHWLSSASPSQLLSPSHQSCQRSHFCTTPLAGDPWRRSSPGGPVFSAAPAAQCWRWRSSPMHSYATHAERQRQRFTEHHKTSSQNVAHSDGAARTKGRRGSSEQGRPGTIPFTSPNPHQPVRAQTRQLATNQRAHCQLWVHRRPQAVFGRGSGGAVK